MSTFNINFEFDSALDGVAKLLTTRKGLTMPNDILGELTGLVLAERELKETFNLAPLTNQKGWDLISDNGTIVEVKQTQGHVWTGKPIVGISAKNKGDSDYFVVLDFHNNRAALIPTGVLMEASFKSFKNERNLQFRWDSEYGDRSKYPDYKLRGYYKENTDLFLKYEIEL